MGWGSGGKGAPSRSGGDWGRQKRANEQAVMKEAKNAREADYFWEKQKVLGSNKPFAKTGWKLQEEEKELFGQHDGTVGINFDKYDSIQVEVSGAGSEQIEPLESFADLSGRFQIPAFVKTNISKCKYTKPTPVQRFSIPVALSGRDAMCCAQTGSGKTCAFLVPILCKIDEKTATGSVGIVVGQPAAPKAVIMAPTRELCSQIHMEARKLAFKSKIRASEIYGGVEAKPQLWELALGSDIVTATPGRLKDFIDRGVVTMSQITFLVLDEADRMLDMGFEPQIREIVQKRDMPTPQQGRNTLMFSATFPQEIQKLAQQFMKNYVWVGVGQVGAAVETVQHEFILATNHQKQQKLFDVLKANAAETTLVFVAMKRTAAALEEALGRGGIRAAAIHGDMEQPAREAALKSFRSGKVSTLVATDVASRGLDIPTVSHVINYDLPENFEDFVHRVGRTGRVGREGWATSFYSNQGNFANTKILGALMGLLEGSGKPIPAFMQQEAKKLGIKPWVPGKKNKFGGSDARGGQIWSSSVNGGSKGKGKIVGGTSPLGAPSVASKAVAGKGALGASGIQKQSTNVAAGKAGLAASGKAAAGKNGLAVGSLKRTSVEALGGISTDAQQAKKTKICYAFQQGKCKWGAECYSSHV